MDEPEADKKPTPPHYHYQGEPGTRGRPCTSSVCALPLAIGLLRPIEPEEEEGARS